MLYLRCQTNNLVIMKRLKTSVDEKLRLDVMEFTFVAWLIRRGIFIAFQTNYDRISTFRMTFRAHLREHIRHVYRTPSLGPEALISSAFLFPSTPEGFEFWTEHSDAWQRFYNSL